MISIAYSLQVGEERTLGYIHSTNVYFPNILISSLDSSVRGEWEKGRVLTFRSTCDVPGIVLGFGTWDLSPPYEITEFVILLPVEDTGVSNVRWPLLQ